MADQDGILSIADARRAGEGDAPQIESELWARLAHAADAASFSAQWLDIQCRLLNGVVESALTSRHVAVHGVRRGMRRQDPVFIAHPILVDDELYGAAALELEGRGEATCVEPG